MIYKVVILILILSAFMYPIIKDWFLLRKQIKKYNLLIITKHEQVVNIYHGFCKKNNIDPIKNPSINDINSHLKRINDETK